MTMARNLFQEFLQGAPSPSLEKIGEVVKACYIISHNKQEARMAQSQPPRSLGLDRIPIRNRNANRIPVSAYLPHSPFRSEQQDDTPMSDRSRSAAQGAHEAALNAEQHQRQLHGFERWSPQRDIYVATKLQPAKKYVYLVHREDIALDNETEGRLEIVGCFTNPEAAVKCAKSVIHRLRKDHDGDFYPEVSEDKKATFYAATVYLLTHPDHVKVTVVKMDLEVEHESYESEEEEDEEQDSEATDDDDVVMEEPTSAQQLNAANEQMRATNETAARFLGKRVRKVDEGRNNSSSKKPKTT